MSKKRTGINSLAYMGVEASTPPQFGIYDRAPTVNDYKEFNIGYFWLYYVSNTIQRLYVLTSKYNHQAIWQELSSSSDIVGAQGEVLIGASDGTAEWSTLTAGTNITITNGDHSITIDASGGGGSGAEDFVTDSGTATIIGTTLNIIGGNLISTSGSSNTVEIDLDNGTDGQVLIGGGTDPVWANITAGTGISITNAANSITIEATGTEPGDLPIGSIIQYDGSAFIDASWSDCDGSVISQTTYATLYGRVGHMYNYPTYSVQTTNNNYNRMIVHNQLAGAEGLWVAVGTSGGGGTGISYSSDGTSWTAATSPFTTTNILAVAHNGQSGVNGLWIALNASSTGTELIATSPDGVTWTLNPLTVTVGYQFESIVHNQKASPNGLWVISLNRGAGFYTSPDGTTWTSRLGIGTDASIYKYGLCFLSSADKFAAFSTNSTNSYSPPIIAYKTDPTDGGFWDTAFTYQAHTYNGDSPRGLGMAIGNGNIVFSGNGFYSFAAPQVFVSNNATTYRSSGICLDFTGNGSSPTVPVVIGGDDDYAYIKTNEGIYYSSDGLSWELYTYASGGLSIAGYISMTSNNYVQPDRVNIINDGATIKVGKTALNTSTEFYLPTLTNKIIRIL